jgi:hypothetical protein
VLEICTVIDSIDHFCEVSLKSHQQLDLGKLDKIFLFIALLAILCSGAEDIGDMHNFCEVPLKSSSGFGDGVRTRLFYS